MPDQDIPSDVGLPSQPVTDDIYKALTELLLTGTDPAILESQRIMLRRLALQGDVARSRIPAPANITEIGGYLNLISEYKNKTLEAQTLASVLGVAGPDITEGPILQDHQTTSVKFNRVVNYIRPNSGILKYPYFFLLRSDLQLNLEQFLSFVKQKGGFFPLITPRILPGNLSKLTPSTSDDFEGFEVFPIIGREFRLPEGIFFKDPSNDLLVVGKPAPPARGDWTIYLRSQDTHDTSAQNLHLNCVKFNDTDNPQISFVTINGRFINLQLIAQNYGLVLFKHETPPDSIEKLDKFHTVLSPDGLQSISPLSGVNRATSLKEELCLIYPEAHVNLQGINFSQYFWAETDFKFKKG